MARTPVGDKGRPCARGDGPVEPARADLAGADLADGTCPPAACSSEALLDHGRRRHFRIVCGFLCTTVRLCSCGRYHVIHILKHLLSGLWGKFASPILREFENRLKYIWLMTHVTLLCNTWSVIVLVTVPSHTETLSEDTWLLLLSSCHTQKRFQEKRTSNWGRPHSWKALELTRDYLHDLCVSKRLLDRKQKALTIEKNTENWTLLKLRLFCLSIDMVKKRKWKSNLQIKILSLYQHLICLHKQICAKDLLSE